MARSPPSCLPRSIAPSPTLTFQKRTAVIIPLLQHALNSMRHCDSISVTARTCQNEPKPSLCIPFRVRRALAAALARRFASVCRSVVGLIRVPVALHLGGEPPFPWFRRSSLIRTPTPLTAETLPICFQKTQHRAADMHSAPCIRRRKSCFPCIQAHQPTVRVRCHQALH